MKPSFFVPVLKSLAESLAESLSKFFAGSLAESVERWHGWISAQVGMNRASQLALTSTLLVGFGICPSLARGSDHCSSVANVATVVSGVRATSSYLGALDDDIDKCFNPAKAQYLAQTHEIMNSLRAQYAQALPLLALAQNDIMTDQKQRFVGDAGQVVANLNSVNKPVLDQAANLRRFGFTTSDATLNGQYRYPQCNSRINDNPAQTFAGFYSNLLSLRQALANLAAAVTCVQSSN